jgi:AGCS family alanine or glycine:cation symporter
MSFEEIVGKLNSIAWGPWMLILLVGTGIFLTTRVGFLQLKKFGYAMKNTIGKIFTKQTAGEGEIVGFALHGIESQTAALPVHIALEFE